jgi:UDP-3-O-[3-hydroxymyristoyl] N-acetylglucosamine deacetylase
MDGLLDRRLIDGRIGGELYPVTPVSQFTLKQPISFRGIGLHTGRHISVRLLPAPANHGVVFRRTDLGVDIPALFDQVSETKLSTVIARDGVQVGTIEHLMAALSAEEIDNVAVEVDGPEMPVLDGSAEGFIFLLQCAGRVDLPASRQVIEILAPVRVEEGAAFAELRPSERPGLDLALSIDFAAPAIGQQALSLHLSPSLFRDELMRARTFIYAEEVAALQQSGLALGGSLQNAIVVDGAQVLNPEGLRMSDEFVRHKMLDMVGDLALAGADIHGRVVAHRTGHTLNNRLLRQLFATPSAWRFASQVMTRDWLSAA